MKATVLRCDNCGAPLPATNEVELCAYCGAANRVVALSADYPELESGAHLLPAFVRASSPGSVIRILMSYIDLRCRAHIRAAIGMRS